MINHSKEGIFEIKGPSMTNARGERERESTLETQGAEHDQFFEKRASSRSGGFAWPTLKGGESILENSGCSMTNGRKREPPRDHGGSITKHKGR